MKVPSNPGNSKDIHKPTEQVSTDEMSSAQKRTEKEQSKNPGRQHEVVERESPEVHSDKDPRVN